MNPYTIGFIGLGLIGGSIAKSLKRVNPDIQITAYDPSAEALRQAQHLQIIDTICHSAAAGFEDCDFIFLCAPVAANIAYLEMLKNQLKPDCILTDAGSVKSDIHQVIRQKGLAHCFIGGHPMAGSEKTGFHNSTDHLIENAYYILTPEPETSPAALTRYQQLVQELGAIPLVMDAQKHDYITACISHLPHIIAASLVNLVETADSADGLMKLVAAGGFKDITRIASSSPDMWQQICLTNPEPISLVLDRYISTLIQARQLIDEKEPEGLYQLFAQAREYRNSIPDASLGPIKRIYAVYCDIIDETGGIATIATILATNHISIKNIGIIHNREFEEGVLRIEFYDSEASAQAVMLLKRHHYLVYER